MFLAPPNAVGLTPTAYRDSPLASQPIPDLLDITSTGNVLTNSHELLVRVEGDRVRGLPLYHDAGWEQAPAHVLVRSGVLARLLTAALMLPSGFGLVVIDGWRSLALQYALHEAANADGVLPPGFVAPPNTDPGRPPAHLTGGTVDITLEYSGQPLALGTQFDDFTDMAFARALEVAGISNETSIVARDLRRILYHAMSGAGFVVNDMEWWHFEYGTRYWSAVTCESPIYQAAAPQVPSRQLDR